MSSRVRIMGAGNGGASKLFVNPHLNTAGGDKKQGLTSRVGLNYWSDRYVQIKSTGTPYQRNTVYCQNQLSGVGAGHSMFFVAGSYNSPDGAKRCNPYQYKTKYQNIPNSSYSRANTPLGAVIITP